MVVAHKILVSAPVPLELIGPLTGFDWVGAGPRGVGDKGLGLGLDNCDGGLMHNMTPDRSQG